MFSLGRRIKCFPSTLRWRTLKTQQSAVIWDLCLRKTRAEESRDNHDVIAFEKCFSFTLKRKAGVSKFLRFKERFRKALLVWTIDLTVQIKLRFQISPA